MSRNNSKKQSISFQSAKSSSKHGGASSIIDSSFTSQNIVNSTINQSLDKGSVEAPMILLSYNQSESTLPRVNDMANESDESDNGQIPPISIKTVLETSSYAVSHRGMQKNSSRSII